MNDWKEYSKINSGFIVYNPKKVSNKNKLTICSFVNSLLKKFKSLYHKCLDGLVFFLD